MYKNVVILCIDSLRADGTSYTHKNIHGKKAPFLTPNIDKFIKKGEIHKTYSTNTYTTAAHASLFTGAYPYEHGIRAFFNFEQKLNLKTKTLAEELNELGFQSFFYSDVPELFSEMDIWRGFKVKTHEKMEWLWSSIEDLKKERNFIFMHIFDIHEPYLFIEDQSADKKINEEYFDYISDLRRKLNIKSKIDTRKNPHNSFREIRTYLIENQVDERDYLMPMYLKGIELFDKLRFNKIIESLDSVGIKQDETLMTIMSDHGEGKTSFKTDRNFGHAGETTDDVLRIFHFTNNSRSKKPVKSIAHIKPAITNCISNNKTQYPTIKINGIHDYLYAESWISNFNGEHFSMEDDDKILRKVIKNKIEIQSTILNRTLIQDDIKILLHGAPESIYDNFGKNNKEFVDLTYKNILGRSPGAEEMDHHINLLSTNKLTKKALISAFFNSEEGSRYSFIQPFKTSGLEDEKINYNIFATKHHKEISHIIQFLLNRFN